MPNITIFPTKGPGNSANVFFLCRLATIMEIESDLLAITKNATPIIPYIFSGTKTEGTKPNPELTIGVQRFRKHTSKARCTKDKGSTDAKAP